MKVTNILLQVNFFFFLGRFFIVVVKNFYIVNSVAWAPHELGAILACASSDGKISILEYKGINYTVCRLKKKRLNEYKKKMMDLGKLN